MRAVPLSCVVLLLCAAAVAQIYAISTEAGGGLGGGGHGHHKSMAAGAHGAHGAHGRKSMLVAGGVDIQHPQSLFTPQSPEQWDEDAEEEEAIRKVRA